MKRAFPHPNLESGTLEVAPTFAPPKNTTAKNTVQHANPVAPPNAPLGDGAMVQTGSTAWSSRSSEEKNPGNTPNPLDKMDKKGRVIFASDLEPILTRLEPTPTGPRLVLESEAFTAILPASPFILKLLARKLQTTVTA